MWTLSGFADEIADDLATQCAVLDRLGVRHLELRSAWGVNVLDLDDDQVEQARRLLADHDIAVSSIGSPIGKVKVDDDLDEHLRRHQTALRRAEQLSAPYVRLFSFFVPAGDDPDRHRDEVLRRMSALAAAAEGRDVVLLHENEKGIYGDTPERCLDIVESVGSASLRLAWDAANFVQCGVRPFTEGYAMLRPHLAYMQIKDALLATGEVVPAGEGDGETLETLRALRSDGFDGFFSLEPAPRRCRPVRRVLRSGPVHQGARRLHRPAHLRRDRLRMTEPLGFAVVGCGVIGRVHARSVRRTPGAELVVAVDPVLGSARAVAEEYGGTAVSSLEEALARDDVDAVAVCTPSGAHASLAVQALRAGKHVVVEKPVDVTAEAADALVEAVAQTGLTATVISQHRFDPSSLAVHDAVRSGRFGTLTSGLASVAWWRDDAYYASGDWRGTWALDGGGALMNQGIHTLDLLVWMLGRPVEVHALAGRLAHDDIEVEDTTVATLRFESGALGVLHATTAAYPGLTARLQVHGSQGSAVIDDDRLVEFRTSDGAGNPVQQGVSGAAAGSDPTAVSDAHDLQFADFVDAVRTGREPHVTVASATDTLRAVLAVYESASTGAAVRL